MTSSVVLGFMTPRSVMGNVGHMDDVLKMCARRGSEVVTVLFLVGVQPYEVRERLNEEYHRNKRNTACSSDNVAWTGGQQ